MKRPIQVILSLVVCLLLPVCAIAQGLELMEPVAGSVLFPQGAAQEDAQYTFTYSYPQFEADTEVSQAINAYYQAIGQDMAQAVAQRYAQEAEFAEMSGAYTEISYQVMKNDEQYLSVVISSRQLAGNAESETISADTFALDGMYAGQPITLSQVLGLEQEGGEFSDAQSMAEKLAYRLVWEIVQRESENVDADFLDGLSETSLRSAFSPETDFYMDMDGNVVFFIQAGIIAGEVAGILTYPFAPAELLSAVKE